MSDLGPGSSYHKTAMRNAKRMKKQAWERGEHFCPTCGVRMWFPGFEKKSRENRSEQRAVMVTLDHYVARSLGGSNEYFNLRLICATCNCEKSKDEQASLS